MNRASLKNLIQRKLRYYRIVFANPKTIFFALPRAIQLIIVLFIFVFVPVWIYTFTYVICGVSYQQKNYQFDYIYCATVDYTPRNYHYNYFSGDWDSHNFLDSWTDFQTLNVSFYSDSLEEGYVKSIPKNNEYSSIQSSGKLDARIHLINANKYILNNRPQMKNYIDTLTRVEKSDYLRYLNIEVTGGIYSDADVRMKVLVNNWLPKFNIFTREDIMNLDFVIGLESDKPKPFYHRDKNITIHLPIQLCQWTFVGKKESFMFTKVREGVEKKIIEVNSKSLYQDEVMIKTGPGIFTEIVLDVISEYSEIKGKDESGMPYAIMEMKEPLLKHGIALNLSIIERDDDSVVRGVLLPSLAFGVWTQTYSVIYHGFKGSWKKIGEGIVFDNYITGVILPMRAFADPGKRNYLVRHQYGSPYLKMKKFNDSELFPS